MLAVFDLVDVAVGAGISDFFTRRDTDTKTKRLGGGAPGTHSTCPTRRRQRILRCGGSPGQQRRSLNMCQSAPRGFGDLLKQTVGAKAARWCGRALYEISVHRP